MIRKLSLIFTIIFISCLEAIGIDIEEAKIWCDSNAADRIEGIWEFPEDGVLILISKISTHSYKAVVVEAATPKLLPGTELATFTATPADEVYDMSFFTRSDAGLLHTPKHCSATMTSDGRGLKCVATKKWVVSFNPMAILPAFQRFIRVREDRGGEIPRGVIKIYPRASGSERRESIIL